jgi:2'-5' RNA ligase
MFAPFSLKFQHLGYGPQPERPRLLWAVCTATDEIAALRLALMQAFGQTDARPFRPHVTVARIRAAEHDFARRHPIDRCLDFVQLVRTIELFRSPPPGATGYHILASIDLDSPRASAVSDALINH